MGKHAIYLQTVRVNRIFCIFMKKNIEFFWHFVRNRKLYEVLRIIMFWYIFKSYNLHGKKKMLVTPLLSIMLAFKKINMSIHTIKDKQMCKSQKVQYRNSLRKSGTEACTILFSLNENVLCNNKFGFSNNGLLPDVSKYLALRFIVSMHLFDISCITWIY